jgi:hypothetical protein
MRVRGRKRHGTPRHCNGRSMARWKVGMADG